MGTNNNNAGMHLIRHNHYAMDEDLDYYDRKAIEEYKLKCESERKKLLESQNNESFNVGEKSISDDVKDDNKSSDGSEQNDQEKSNDPCFIYAIKQNALLISKVFLVAIQYDLNLRAADTAAEEAILEYYGEEQPSWDYNYFFANYCMKFWGMDFSEVEHMNHDQAKDVIYQKIVSFLSTETCKKDGEYLSYVFFCGDACLDIYIRASEDAGKIIYTVYAEYGIANCVFDHSPSHLFSGYMYPIYSETEGQVADAYRTLINQVEERY